MRRWIAIGLIALAVAIGLGAYFGDGDGPPWRDHKTEVITTTEGQTIVIDRGHDGPPFPFLIIPFLIFGLFWFGFRRGPGRGDGPWNNGPGPSEAWLRDWHRREHGSDGSDPGGPGTQPAN